MHIDRVLFSKFVSPTNPKSPWQISFSTDIISCSWTNLTCFSEAEEGVTDFDERHNPRFVEDVAKNAEGIGILELFNFKVDRSTREETSVQYENDILHCMDGVAMLQVRNNKHKKVIPIDQLEALDVPHYPYTFVIVDMRSGNLAILVQQKSSAFKNSDEVAGLVRDYCSRVS